MISSSFARLTPGLYRTAEPLPGHELAIPAATLVYLGETPGGAPFVVRPTQNRHNRWFWETPTLPLTASHATWARGLIPLRSEGFYTLPEEMNLDGGGRWVKNAIVQLGYNRDGQGIVFVAERREGDPHNALHFSDRGVVIADVLLARLLWAPILPVEAPEAARQGETN